MTNYRTFQVSDKYFWGFKTRIDINNVFSKEDIINIVKLRMISILKEHNFTVLHEKLEGKQGNEAIQYHIHEKTFNDILNANEEEVIYVCNHDCN